MAYTTLKTQLVRDGVTRYKVRYSDDPDECMWIKTKTGASQSELDVLVDEGLAEIAAEETRQQEYQKKLEEINIPLEGRTI
tara:strand:+ start:6534 stop:6776 length:243 start_codon:yes stop_codon:yes gene_type:complete